MAKETDESLADVGTGVDTPHRVPSERKTRDGLSAREQGTFNMPELGERDGVLVPEKRPDVQRSKAVEDPATPEQT